MKVSNQDDNKRKGMNVRRSLLYQMIVKDNVGKSFNLDINFESESMEQHTEEAKVDQEEEIFNQLASEIIEQQQQLPIKPPEPQSKLIETLRLSFQVQIQNLATKFKMLMKEAMERRLIDLKKKFELECHQVMNLFFDLKASFYEKEILIKHLQQAICDVENNFVSKNNTQRRLTIVPIGGSSNHQKQLQLENLALKEEVENFRKELERLKQQTQFDEIEIIRLKAVEQQKFDGDKRQNELTEQIKEQDRKFFKFQQSQRLSSPLKGKKKSMENNRGLSIVKENEDSKDQTGDLRQSQEALQKMLQDSRLKDQNQAQFNQKLKDRIKEQSDQIASLQEQLLLSEKMKLQKQPQNYKYFNDLLLTSCFSRPSTSVNFYYNAPQSALTQPTQTQEFRLEKLKNQKNLTQLTTPTKYEFNSQGFVTKIEKLNYSVPISTRSSQRKQVTLLDIKRANISQQKQKK